MLLKKGYIFGMSCPKQKLINIVVEDKNYLSFKVNSIVTNMDKEPFISIVKKNSIYNPELGYTKTMLYLFVKEDIVIGDYFLNMDHNFKIQKSDIIQADVYKLIACNDPSFSSAKLSKKFLYKYVDKQGISQVFVNYEESHNKIEVKTNKFNEVSVREYKSTYTGKEVIELLKLFMFQVYDNVNKAKGLNWIKEHL